MARRKKRVLKSKSPLKANKRIYVTYDPDTYDQIVSISKKTGKSLSSIACELTAEGLTLRVNQENIDMITKIIREQLRDVLQPSVERLASLTAKTCIQASTAAFLTAETINKFVPISEQEDVVDVYNAARKKAVEYTKTKNEYTEG